MGPRRSRPYFLPPPPARRPRRLAFAPAHVSAHVGDTVEWTNEDFVAHTATARNGAWDVRLAPHSNGSAELKAPGEVEYYCRFRI